jgi:hypothetical protein
MEDDEEPQNVKISPPKMIPPRAHCFRTSLVSGSYVASRQVGFLLHFNNSSTKFLHNFTDVGEDHWSGFWWFAPFFGEGGKSRGCVRSKRRANFIWGRYCLSVLRGGGENRFKLKVGALDLGYHSTCSL